MSDIVEVEIPQIVVIDDTNLQIISVAEQGPVGPSGAVTYIHDQATPSATWTISHNLDRYPAVSVVDSAGNTVICDAQYTSADSLTITFSAAFSGRAYLN